MNKDLRHWHVIYKSSQVQVRLSERIGVLINDHPNLEKKQTYGMPLIVIQIQAVKQNNKRMALDNYYGI